MYCELPRSTHYLDRCLQRGIPRDAHEVVTAYGRKEPGKNGATHYRIHRIDALRLAAKGILVWRYTEIIVVVSREGVAITAYRRSEDA